jgi:ABC-type transport system involved in multi-copper enzyme maturation permease subunit
MIWGVVSTRGRVGTITSGMWQSFALVGVRSLVLGLVAATVGFTLASIGRHTATALGIAVGYVVVIEAGGEVFSHVLNIARPERFLLSRYVAAWLAKVQHFSGPEICTHQTGGITNCSQGTEWVMRMGSAAEVVGILIAALLVWAYVSFWRRDVT